MCGWGDGEPSAPLLRRRSSFASQQARAAGVARLRSAGLTADLFADEVILAAPSSSSDAETSSDTKIAADRSVVAAGLIKGHYGNAPSRQRTWTDDTKVRDLLVQRLSEPHSTSTPTAERAETPLSKAVNAYSSSTSSPGMPCCVCQCFQPTISRNSCGTSKEKQPRAMTIRKTF